MKHSPAGSILCGTDFSPHAAQATATAAALARQWHKPLVLLHVADEFNANAEPPERLESFLGPLRTRLEKECAELAANGHAVTGEVLHGDVAEMAILEYAEKHPAELVVLSAMSKTAFDRWTLGSVSESVAEGADATTLVVRSSQPFEEWERGERPLKIFVAVDFSAAADAALRWVSELRQLGPCEVTAGYVHWPPEEHRRFGVGGPEHFTANIPEVQRLLERDLREKVNAVLGEDGAEIRVQASWGRVDVPLIDLAVAAKADLLVVGTHRRRGLDHWTKGSVSRVLLRHAPMNVACVSAAAAPSRAPMVRSCHRVLAAVDLSEHGGLALPYAYSVVDDGGTVNLVHVVKPFRWANSLISGMPDVMLSKAETEERIAHGSACLRALIPAGMESRRIQTEVQIIEDDDAARAICQAGEAFNADIVCIGAHARPGAAARIMGSVALGILQQCRRAVLVAWPPPA